MASCAQLCSKWPAVQYRANCVANGQLCSIWPTVSGADTGFMKGGGGGGGGGGTIYETLLEAVHRGA